MRDPKTGWSNGLETDLENSTESEPEIEDKKMGKAQPSHRPLIDIIFPPRTSELSCFNILAQENITLKLKAQYTHMFPKFTCIEDAYMFRLEFQDVCFKMCYPNVHVDAMRLKFILFALKDNAKN